MPLQLADLGIATDSNVEEQPEEGKGSMNGGAGMKLPETELREPEEYYLAEAEEPDGQLVYFDEASRVYHLGDDDYVTIIGGYSGLYLDEDGLVKEVDNTFIEKRTGGSLKAAATTASTYENKAGGFQVGLPAVMSRTKGFTLAKDGYQIELIPTKGDFSKSLAAGNAIRYSDVFPGVDYQYTLTGNSLKEDIILLAPSEMTEFSFEIKAPGLRAKAEGNKILLYPEKETGKKNNSEPVFILEAPLMIDAAGEMSLDINLSLKKSAGKTIATVTIDEEWLLDEERAYPVRIDPTTFTLVPSNFYMLMAADGQPDTYFGTQTPLVGYQAGYGNTRTYMTLMGDLHTIIGGPLATSASFRIGQMTNNSNGTTEFLLCAPQEIWQVHLTWNNQRDIPFIEAARQSAQGANQFVEFDITDLMNSWIQTSTHQIGLMIKAEFEPGTPAQLPGAMAAEAFYNQTSDLYGPRLEVYWSGEFETELGLRDINDLTIEVQPIIEESFAGGKSALGVLSYGLSQADSTVTYTLLTEDEEINQETATVVNELVYPDFTANGEYPYADNDQVRDGNWQSRAYPQPEMIETDKIYQLKAFAEGVEIIEDPETGEKERGEETVTSEEKFTDTFLLYPVQYHDLVYRIARHYEVEVETILRDNNLPEQLTVAGDLLFIRNPATVEPYTYEYPTELEQLLIDLLLLGRGLHCEFGFEPINMNTGNFYMEQEDAVIPDLGGGFAIRRSYNSLVPYLKSPFGKGWTSPLGRKVTVLPTGDLLYLQGDGSGIAFTVGADGRYYAPDGYDMVLEKTNELIRSLSTPKTLAVPPIETENGLTQALTVMETETIEEVAEDHEEDDFEIEENRNEDETEADESIQPEAATESGLSAEGWQLKERDGTLLTFNVMGLLRYSEDMMGNRTTYEYDEFGNLQTIISPTGNIFMVETNEKDLITDIHLPNGGVITYTYDEEENLMSVTDPEGGIRRYEYDELHQMTAWYDENGSRIVQNTYDENGRVVAQLDANGKTAYLSYEEGKTIATDNLGYVTEYHYDERLRTTAIFYPDGTSVYKAYNQENQLISETDELGQTTAYSYDERGNRTTEKWADGAEAYYEYNDLNCLTKMTDFAGNVTVFTYDEKGNLLSVTDAEGNSEYYEYDTQNRLIKKTDKRGNAAWYEYAGAMVTKITDREGNIWRLEYDTMNNLLREQNPEGYQYTYSYDKKGRRLTETDGAGGTITYTFDPAGNVIAIKDALGTVTIFEYDALYHIIQGTDGAGNTLTYEYDANYNRIAEWDTNGNGIRNTYDARGRLLENMNSMGESRRYGYDQKGNLTTITDEAGNKTIITYHPLLSLPLTETNPLGHQTTYEYDTMGNLTAAYYPDGTKTTYSYDRNHRLTTIGYENGLVTKLTYDGNDNLISMADGDLRSFQFTYDKNDNLIKTVNPLGGTILYGYDKAGNQISVTNEEGYKEVYQYDGAGRLTAITDPLAYQTRLTYNRAGWVTQIQDQNGGTEAYYYDALGQLLATQNPADEVTGFAYDNIGNILKVTDALQGETTYSYDKLYRAITMTDPAGGKYTYEYDKTGNITKIRFPDVDEVTMTYDGAGQITTFTDEAGVASSFRYDEMGRIISMSDNLGNQTHYEYDGMGNLISEQDTIGRRITYDYDLLSRLVKVTGKDGTATLYEYDLLDRLTTVTNGEGQMTTYEYDKTGNLVKRTEPGEAIYHFEYDARGQLIKTINPLGGENGFVYDGNGNLLKVTDGEGRETFFSYDLVNRLTTYQDGNGGETYYEYDALSRLLAVQTPEGIREEYRYDSLGNLTKWKDGNGAITEYRYDVMGNLLTAISPKGAKITYTYDKHDELTSITDAAGNVTLYDVDLNRRVTRMVQPNGGEYHYDYDKVHRLIGITTPLGYQSRFTYTSGDDLIREEDNLGRRTTYEYDIMHRLIKVIDAEGGETAYAYDIRGNLERITDALGYQNQYEYDLLDQMVGITDPEGKMLSVIYDLTGNIKAVIKPADRTTAYEYDGNDNIIGLTDPKGYLYESFYNKDNRLVKTIDPLKQTEAVIYDNNGWVLSFTDKMGLTEGYEYDLHGNLTAFTATNGLRTRYSYDILDQLITVTDPMNRSASYTYDEMGNLLTMTEGMGRTTRYTYDIEGNMTSLTDVSGRQEQMSYDIIGRLISYTSPGGNKIAYDYDKLNRLVEKSYEDASGNPVDEGVIYGYDALGQRVAMMDRSGESSYVYDGLGRITSVTSGSGEVVTYRYDEGDRLAAIGYPDGTQVGYEYDKNDNLISVTDRNNQVTRYEYDAINRITKIVRPNGIHTINTYNARNQIIKLENICPDCEWVVSSYEYSYNDRGFIVGEKAVESLYQYVYDDKHNGKHDDKHDSKYPHGNRHNGKHDKDGTYSYQIIETNRSFVYDDNGQLLRAVEDEEKIGRIVYTYEYDAGGNRIYYGKSLAGTIIESARYTYNDANQMVKAEVFYDKKHTTISYEYDSDGNLIAETGKKGTDQVELTYLYTVENRLQAVYDGKELLMAAAYDGDGNRIFQLNYNLHTDDDWKGNSGNGNGNNKDNTGNAGNDNSGNNGNENSGNNGNGNNGNGNNGNVGNGNGNNGNGNGNNSSNGNNNNSNGGNDSSNGSGNTTNTGGSQNNNGILIPDPDKVSVLEQELIDLIKTTGKEKNYELMEYVNDVNREHTEVLMELNINGELDTAYVYGAERLAADRFTGDSVFYLYDPRGSVAGVADSSGALRGSYRYEPFGGISFGRPDYNNVYAYNGESYNPNLEGQYLRARYYSTMTGNFLSEDSYLGDMMDILTLNRYTYVKNSPLNYQDPSGHLTAYLSGGTLADNMNKANQNGSQSVCSLDDLFIMGILATLNEAMERQNLIHLINNMGWGPVDKNATLEELELLYLRHMSPFGDGAAHGNVGLRLDLVDLDFWYPTLNLKILYFEGRLLGEAVQATVYANVMITLLEAAYEREKSNQWRQMDELDAKEIGISDKKMYQLGDHFNKHGRKMGYSSKAEYDKAAKEFANINKYNSEAEIFQGTWNGAGINNGKTQIVIRYDGKQVVIDKTSGQIVDFYEGMDLKGLININQLQ